MKILGRQISAIVALCSSSLIFPLQAAENMRLHGVLVEPPPCTINGGGTVEVDFGLRVGVTKVNGVNYREPLAYPISCVAGSGTWVMTLTLGGTAAAFDNAAIVNSGQEKNLAIRIYQNDQPFIVGSSVVINPNSPPVLTAVPVKAPGSELTEGPFEAIATLRAEYQ